MRLSGFARQRFAALGVLASGVVCPCHVLIGLIAFATGGSLLSPAAQDGIHAIYAPSAVFLGAVLLVRRARSNQKSGGGVAN